MTSLLVSLYCKYYNQLSYFSLHKLEDNKSPFETKSTEGKNEVGHVLALR